MVVYGISLSDIEKCAGLVPCKLENVRNMGKGIAFVIRPVEETGEAFRVVSPRTSRRVHAITAEGHYVFFSLLFNHGATKVITSIETFGSKVELEQKARAIIARGGWQGV